MIGEGANARRLTPRLLRNILLGTLGSTSSREYLGSGIMIRCEDCNWTGKWGDCMLRLTKAGKPIDCCPVCGSTHLIEIDDKLVPV